MSDPAGRPILDYASPQSLTRLRLAARSVLRITPLPDGARVSERLEENGAAIRAIIFGAAMLVLLSWRGVTDLRHMDWLTIWVEGGFIATIVLTLAGLIVGVIHDTWRVTLLESSRDSWTLTFQSPLQTRIYSWTNEQMRALIVTMNTDLQDRKYFSLTIQTPQNEFRLFAGHDQAELQSVIVALLEKPKE